MIPHSPSSKELIENWYRAAESNLDTTGRMKLYEDTERTIASLSQSSEADKLLFCRLAQEVFETKSPADSTNLSEWIAKNTGIDKNGYSGAYRTFHELFQTATHLKENSDLEGLALKQIDSQSLDYMDSIKGDKKALLQKLRKDAGLHTLSYLSNKDLVSMSLSSSQNREEVITILINRLNTGENTLDEMGIKTVNQAIGFFGERSLEIFRLDLREFSIDDSDIKNLVENFPKIQHLVLDKSEITNEDASFFEKMNHLTHLDLAQCIDLSFLASCPSLRSLTFRNSEVSDIGILEKCPFLTSLNLELCPRIQDISVLKNLPSLTSLSLSCCGQINDFSFLEHCKDLRSLDLSECRQISDVSFLQHCKDLRSLDLSGCGKINNFSFLEHCKDLRSLNLRECKQINDFSFLQNCKNLIYLDLARSKIKDISCLQHCKKLASLKLQYCNEINDISSLQHCKDLATLNLLMCNQINDISCLQHCKELVDLNLERCKQIKDISCLQHCKGLTILNLSDCEQINDISSLQHYKELATLNLSWCKQINDISFLQHCKELTRLSLLGCTQINKSDIELLRNRGVTITGIR